MGRDAKTRVVLEYITVDGVVLATAYFMDHRGRFTLGETPQEALGMLVQIYPDVFGVHVEWNFEGG